MANGAYKTGIFRRARRLRSGRLLFFAALDGLERYLSRDERHFLAGEALTEADLRLFPTLLRFDDVYATRFLLNLRRPQDHPRLYRWRRRTMAGPGVAFFSNLDHCKKGDFGRKGHGLIPLTPEKM